MNDLAQWLGTQFDEDERIAREATPGPWRAHDTHLGQYGYAATVLSGEGNDTNLRAWFPSMSQQPWDEARNVWNDAEHVARHDPARVLREIEAQRRLLAAYVQVAANDVNEVEYAHGYANALGEAVRLLALPFADRPGYRESWRP